MSRNNENRLVPIFRFPEFNNNRQWEEKSISEVASLVTDYVANGSFESLRENVEVQDSRGYALYIRLTDLRAGLGHSEQKYVNESSYKFLNKSALYGGELLIANIGANVGEVWQVPKLEMPATLAPNMIMMKFITLFDSSYIFQFLGSEQGQKNISKAISGSGHPKINKTDLKQVILTLPPTKDEQQKIAACLSSLDEVIKAESQKLEVLKEHKKGFLQNLFPQEGETVPKFRFKEFNETGDWKETTLTQVADYENGKAHEQDIADAGKFIVVNSKFISQNGEVKKFTNTAFLPATKGDVLMVLSDIPNGRAIAKCFHVEEDNRYTVNQRICRITPKNLNSKILYYLLNRNPYFLSFDDGVKQTNLRKEDVLNCPLMIPEDPMEQKKIADTLSSIDELIIAQGQKLEALQLHKKGLLQGLFPNLNEVTE